MGQSISSSLNNVDEGVSDFNSNNVTHPSNNNIEDNENNGSTLIARSTSDGGKSETSFRPANNNDYVLLEENDTKKENNENSRRNCDSPLPSSQMKCNSILNSQANTCDDTAHKGTPIRGNNHNRNRNHVLCTTDVTTTSLGIGKTNNDSLYSPTTTSQMLLSRKNIVDNDVTAFIASTSSMKKPKKERLVRNTSFEYTLLSTTNANNHHDDSEVVSFCFQEPIEEVIRERTFSSSSNPLHTPTTTINFPNDESSFFYPSSLATTTAAAAIDCMNRVRAETELTVDDEDLAVMMYPNSSSNNINSNNYNNNSRRMSLRSGGSSSRYQHQRRYNSGSSNYSHHRDSYRYTPATHHTYYHYYPELNGLNYLNAVTYVFHLFVSWGVGIWGLDHIVKTRWEVTVQYETLVTPDESISFYVLICIMMLESLFTIAQLVPYYRARSVIQAGTGYFFFYTFLWQTAFTMFYCFELFVLSFISIIGTLFSLMMLLTSQEQHNSSYTSSYVTPPLLLSSTSSGPDNHTSINMNNHGNSTNNRATKHSMEYFLFRFPFYLHAGWMVGLCSNHVSLLLRWYCADNRVGLQLMSDIVALAIPLPIATYFLGRIDPDFVIPTVILLSYVGIGCRLLHPSVEMIDLYGTIIIDAVCYAAFVLAGIVVCCLIPTCIIWLSREFCTIHVVELE